MHPFKNAIWTKTDSHFSLCLRKERFFANLNFSVCLTLTITVRWTIWRLFYEILCRHAKTTMNIGIRKVLEKQHFRNMLNKALSMSKHNRHFSKQDMQRVRGEGTLYCDISSDNLILEVSCACLGILFNVLWQIFFCEPIPQKSNDNKRI